MFAGASYLDLLIIYKCNQKAVYSAFHEVLGWTESTFDLLPNMVHTKDSNGLDHIVLCFAELHKQILQDIIGAIDGIAIHVRMPSLVFDGVVNPGTITISWLLLAPTILTFAFAVLQVIIFLENVSMPSMSRPYVIMTNNSFGCQLGIRVLGTSHDSLAWSDTDLCQNLEILREWLQNNEYYLIGDSAYDLLLYFLVPYGEVQGGST